MIKAGFEELLPDEIKVFKKKSDRIGDVYNQHACITSAKFAYFIKNIYKRIGDKAYNDKVFEIIWDIFDLIIIDEAHSIVTDASYQEAPFYLYDFIRHFDTDCCDSSKHMLLLTATPEPIENVCNVLNDLHTYDFSEVCAGVVPKSVSIIDSSEVKKEIEAKYLEDKNWKCVYFYSGDIILAQDFCRDNNINADEVVSLFSKTEFREGLKKYNLSEYDKMIETEESIIKYGIIPNNTRVLLVTSKFKEGVDFKWFFNTMYIDSHTKDDAIQMSGRARLQNHEVKIVMDSKEFYWFDTFENETKLLKSDYGVLKSLNEKLENLPNEEKSAFIEQVTNPCAVRTDNGVEYHPYIQFSYLDNKFKIYATKALYFKYLKESYIKWHKKDGKLKPNYHQKILQDWFKGIAVEPYYSKDFLIKQILDKYTKYANRLIDKEKQEKIKNTLCEVYGERHEIPWFLKLINSNYRYERDESTKMHKFIRFCKNSANKGTKKPK